ncbi:phosphatidylinositol-3-phosphatase SAC1-like [Mercenaria mercenaria]|uniref:phosphatidylinositol-3-phosphatase SAC1-like n=1 Tax=Mercenaria mercenaria TaxID=6596 RepID=UPI00234EF4F2|nr:phosphatidylinositol-3-phosphatase SAC1-like [Mercenaria mercenaria]
MAVHETLQLHITSEKFIFEPIDTGENELLIIDRVTQEIYLQANDGQIPAAGAITKPVCGIMGIIRLIAGPYLLVITKKEKVGEIQGHVIWKITGTELHSYKRTMLHLTEKQTRDNGVYVSMVESVLKTGYFYFSTTYDITHTLQRLHNTSPDFISIPLHERADQRFLWNNHVLRELSQQADLGRYCLPVMHGFMSISSSVIDNKSVNYILISRRCVYRAGTRFNVRGLDMEGQVANFVETEQILQYDGTCCSYVQTRGSIPLHWTQRPCLKYMPLPQLRTTNHIEGMSRHFEDQVFLYGDQVVVNLVNSKGYESQLEKALKQYIADVKNTRVKYEYFDFHHECRKMRWDRLAVLVSRLEPLRKQFGYFMVTDGTVSKQQEGVFRSNCMDCLDRTNVVQGLFAKVTLEEQLHILGITDSVTKIEEFSEFKNIFNNVWADNADTISKQYAGTGALKTDFTRTGKRTKLGLLMDGWNSLTRYFKNNFSDGFRQDSIDLFLGNYQVEENEGITKPSPFQTERDWKFYAIPVIFVIAMSMLIISILIPDEHVSEQLLYVLFWGTASFVSLAVIYRYGSEFVDQPRLVHTKVKMD